MINTDEKLKAPIADLKSTLDTEMCIRDRHKVVNGKDTVVAIFDGKHFVEVKGK